MLQVKNLHKQYDGQKAVNDVSFEIQKGDIFGLLGPNGAGKSSLLRMVTGITMPDEGSILFNGEILNGLKHSAKIGYMPEERGLYKKMKVGEHAIYLAQLKGLTAKVAEQKVKHWFRKLEMQTWWDKKVEDLSKGMSQKLQFVTTIAHEPDLLILDEPFSGLDPVNSKIIKDVIDELAQGGTTIIFSTHRMEQVEEICKDIVLMNKGKVILEGDVNEIKQRFKEHVFQLILNHEITSPLPFTVLSEKNNTYQIKLKDNDEANQLLRHCIDNGYSIHSYMELLPSLNDIFINLVEGNAVTKFQIN
jgi:ABC-2 type transport system ATP-binding protein